MFFLKQKKIYLEAVSIIFQVKIVIYFISEEFYLNSMIINNKFNKTVELMRLGNHYDVILSNLKMETKKMCQSILT